MDNIGTLKSRVLSNYTDKKYREISLIDLFATDNEYYSILESRGDIDEDIKAFFHSREQDILSIGKLTIGAYRKLKYEAIIDNYLKEFPQKETAQETAPEIAPKTAQTKRTKTEATKKETDERAAKRKGDDPKKKEREKNIAVAKARIMQRYRENPLHCMKDISKLDIVGVENVTIQRTGEKFLIPLLQCPKCKRKYTSVKGYADNKVFNDGRDTYRNIDSKSDIIRYENYLALPRPISPASRCYVYNKVKPLRCAICYRAGLEKKAVQYITKKKKVASHTLLYCKNCNVYYINYSEYKPHRNDCILLNPDELSAIEAKERAAAQLQAEKRKQLLDERQVKGATKSKQEQAEEKRIAEQVLEQKQTEPRRSFEQNKQPSSQAPAFSHDNIIRVKDFVVRRTTFKCSHNNHKLQNIDGVMSIIDQDGSIRQTTVPAGYCPNCNIFFIMESTYQNLRRLGTPICRVSDEKAYMSNPAFVNGMQLAQESILMQYGYSVSQEEGLTSARRKKILALLVDNKILTRSEIISYLDFFINQRKYQQKYELAISKWESDRDFIAEYNMGFYTRYGVKGIYRKY